MGGRGRHFTNFSVVVKKGTKSDIIFEYNWILYSLGGLAGNDRRFEDSICASRGHAASKRH